MTRVGIISQARMTSTRLPGKVLLEAGGKSMLQHHLDRLASTGYPVFLATTSNATDEPLVLAAEALGVPCFRGSEDDVLSRFVGAANAFELDVVVRVTSDCPLIDGDVVRTGIDEFLAQGDPNAYVSNVLERTYPRGLDFEVFSAMALREADALATDAIAREHVTPFINQNRTGRVTFTAITRKADASGYRVTLDTPEDFRLLKALFEDHNAETFDADRLISVLTRHPELAAINAEIEQKKLGQ